MDRDPRARMLGVQAPDRPRQQAGDQRRLAGDPQRPGAEVADLAGGLAQVVEPGIGSRHLAGEGRPLRRRHRAAVPAHEQAEAEIGLELGDRAADMRLADAEGAGRARHPAMAQHGAKQVEMGGIYHAQSAWTARERAFDDMG